MTELQSTYRKYKSISQYSTSDRGDYFVVVHSTRTDPSDLIGSVIEIDSREYKVLDVEYKKDYLVSDRFVNVGISVGDQKGNDSIEKQLKDILETLQRETYSGCCASNDCDGWHGQDDDHDRALMKAFDAITKLKLKEGRQDE
jgi:hypothetical protein